MWAVAAPSKLPRASAFSKRALRAAARGTPHPERSESSCWSFRCRVCWSCGPPRDTGCSRSGGTGKSRLSARGLFQTAARPGSPAWHGYGARRRTNPRTTPMCCPLSKRGQSRSPERHPQGTCRQSRPPRYLDAGKYPARYCNDVGRRGSDHLPRGTASAPGRPAPRTPTLLLLEDAYRPRRRTPRHRSRTHVRQDGRGVS